MDQNFSFFIATGSNIGNRLENLFWAKQQLNQYFKLIAHSRVYESPAVDYLNQPDFYNQVLEFEIPNYSAEEVMSILLTIEATLGRNRLILKGPRLIDLDILFWGLEKYESTTLQLPHPRLFERSFVVLPLSELPGFKFLEKKFQFNFNFTNSATPIS